MSTILDSGDRTQFESGAVRDMREGKGRCDLMPLEVVGNYICDDSHDTDHILWNLRHFQKTGSVSYLYSAMHLFELEEYDNCYTMFLEVAKHFEEGAKKYGENNWQKGIPTKCYIDSAIRHYLKWRRGDQDEPHNRAFIWNLMCCIWEENYGENHREDTLVQFMATKKDIRKATAPMQRDITVIMKPYAYRLGDYTKGLFEFDGEVYAKLNTATDSGSCVNIRTGLSREFDPDLVVTIVDIGELYAKEEESTNV